MRLARQLTPDRHQVETMVAGRGCFRLRQRLAHLPDFDNSDGGAGPDERLLWNLKAKAWVSTESGNR